MCTVLTAVALDDLDALGYGHPARLPSAQNPVHLGSTARTIAVALVALETETAADVIERLRYFSQNLRTKRQNVTK